MIILQKYFIDCNALNDLLAVLSDSDENVEIGVTALGKLASNVHVKNPKRLENRFRNFANLSYNPMLDNLQMEDIVTFELDDSSIVQVDKAFLCQKSEVFSAMLMGHFKESIEKNVRLKNVNKAAFEYLLILLFYGVNESKCDIQTFPLPRELETSLETLILADRYLFDNLKVLLRSAIVQFQLTPETMGKVYIWSLNDGMGHLCVESVAYLLTGKMCKEDRIASVKTILELEYKEQCLDDIKAMILRQLVKFYE